MNTANLSMIMRCTLAVLGGVVLACVVLNGRYLDRAALDALLDNAKAAANSRPRPD